MAIPKRENLMIYKGATFSRVLRWDTGMPVFKAITGITQAAPTVITCSGHGVPDGWPVAIVSVKGMTQINASTPPKSSEYDTADYIDTNSFSLLGVDSSLYKAYTSGGYVRYNQPVDLTGYTARMDIRASKNDTLPVLTLDTAGGEIVLNNTDKTITLTIAASVTEALTITKGVYDLELVSPLADVYRLLEGSIVISNEITRT
jgi:hypothetical protein